MTERGARARLPHRPLLTDPAVRDAMAALSSRRRSGARRRCGEASAYRAIGARAVLRCARHHALVLRRRRATDGSPWSHGTTVVRGRLAPGPFEFQRREIVPDRLAPMAVYAFDGVTAERAELDLTDVMLTIQNSEFVACRFVQKRRPASDGSWGQGSLGRRVVLYRDCVFAGVRLRIRAGYSVGEARFDRCRFVRCDFGEHFSFCADYVDCVFEGPVRRAVFYGSAPEGQRCDGKRNEIRGNDFRAATFGDVGFRRGVPVEQQLWPSELDPARLVDEP